MDNILNELLKTFIGTKKSDWIYIRNHDLMPEQYWPAYYSDIELDLNFGYDQSMHRYVLIIDRIDKVLFAETLSALINKAKLLGLLEERNKLCLHYNRESV